MLKRLWKDHKFATIVFLTLLSGLAVAQTIRVLRFDVADMRHITTPSNPASGSARAYFKNDDKLYTLTSGGVETEIGTGGGGGSGQGTNVVDNSDFEISASFWTGSTTAPTRETTGSIGNGLASLQWDPAGAETLESTLAEIPEILEGKACLIHFNYLCDTCVTGDYAFHVEDGDANVLFEALELNLPTAGVWAVAQAGFVCPEDDSNLVELTAVITSAGDEPAIRIDDVHLGTDFRKGVLGDQAELMASSLINGGSCQWSKSGSFPSVPEVSTWATEGGTCTLQNLTGGVVTPTKVSGQPGVTYPNLPTGKYKLTAIGNLVQTNATTPNMYVCMNLDGGALNVAGNKMDCQHWIAVLDQSDNFTVVGTFELTAPANKTAQIYVGSSASGTIAVLNGRTTSGGQGVKFILERFPTLSPRDTVTLDTQPGMWSATIGGANPTLGTATVASYTQIPDTSLTLTAKTNRRSIGVACTAPATEVQEVGDTTCTGSEGNEVLGVIFDAGWSGWYRICSSFTHTVQLNANEIVGAIFRLSETANNSTTVLQSSAKKSTNFQNTTTATETVNPSFPVELCGDFYFSSAGTKRVIIEYVSSVTGTIASTENRILSSDSGTATNTGFSIVALTQNFPQAVALSHVETGATGDCTKGNICSGETTSLSTDTLTNLSSATLQRAVYSRIGNSVTVAATYSINANAAGVISFESDLPIASDFVNTSDLTAVCGNTSTSSVPGGNGVADVTDNQALLRSNVNGGGGATMMCNFQYIVR